MRNAVTLALAAALSTASLGGIAFAQTTSSTTATATSDMNDMIRIVRISENSDSDDANNQVPEMFQSPTAEVTAEAQAEVRATPALLAELQENSIEVDNVLAIDTAANGGKIVYVK